MLDWLKIIEHHKEDCGNLIENMFRDGRYGQPEISIVLDRSSPDLQGSVDAGHRPNVGNKSMGEDGPSA